MLRPNVATLEINLFAGFISFLIFFSSLEYREQTILERGSPIGMPGTMIAETLRRKSLLPAGKRIVLPFRVVCARRKHPCQRRCPADRKKVSAPSTRAGSTSEPHKGILESLAFQRKSGHPQTLLHLAAKET